MAGEISGITTDDQGKDSGLTTEDTEKKSPKTNEVNPFLSVSSVVY